VTKFEARIGGGARTLPSPTVCDVWLADGQRFGNELPGLDPDSVLGRWPAELETDAAVRLFGAIGEGASWEDLANTPPVAQKLAERARPQPLDLVIFQYLQHLQYVCHRPRLNLRIEEERLPVSRARRSPVRAVAELVSHPGDWEHRTLRSIQPSRVLARQIEDEWVLYENRVAVRLVDHLLAYVARRVEELRRIEEALLASRDYSDEARTSFWRARRVTKLWGDTLNTKTEDELRATLTRLGLVQRDLQALLDAPLYRRVPKRLDVALSLRPTNILVNDPHYRKVAALWRAWEEFGHKRQETHAERSQRRQNEARAWDRFVLHLVVRALAGLGWTAEGQSGAWILAKRGSVPVHVEQDSHGLLSVRSEKSVLHLLPICAVFIGTDAAKLLDQVCAWDRLDGEIVGVHVGSHAELADTDRATGWSFGGKASLFGCSPWGIDSEERMARLLNGWLSRSAARPYPLTEKARDLPELPRAWGWVTHNGSQLVGLRAPSASEVGAARSWASSKAKELEQQALQAKQAKQAFAVAPRDAVSAFQRFLDVVDRVLSDSDHCPVCGEKGEIEPRVGKLADGSDATWWATCPACDSEWGLRPCAACGKRYMALAPEVGLDTQVAAEATASSGWPDKVLGRDVWAQPCRSGATGEFRCPSCGACSGGSCDRCRH
jgi:hypothetical protein